MIRKQIRQLTTGAAIAAAALLAAPIAAEAHDIQHRRAHFSKSFHDGHGVRHHEVRHRAIRHRGHRHHGFKQARRFRSGPTFFFSTGNRHGRSIGIFVNDGRHFRRGHHGFGHRRPYYGRSFRRFRHGRH